MGYIDVFLLLIIIALAIIVGKRILRFKSSNISEEKRVEVVSQSSIQSPHITIIFQQDINDDEELCEEIADMFLSNRAFYYSGKSPDPASVPPEKETDVFVRFSNVDFSKLKRIDV